MADQDRPNQAANKSKAEGDRWTSESDSVINADRDEHPERLYEDKDTGEGGGITNRPLSDEKRHQEELPERGTNRDRTQNPDGRRQEGDYGEKER
jgi:hypothetical protein